MNKSAVILRAWTLVALAGILVALLAGCGGTPAPATPAPAQSGGADAAALLQERCSVCHSASKAAAESHTQQEWESIVSQMIQKGAKLSDAEKAALVEYLAATYGE